jgi:hypothetical protein
LRWKLTALLASATSFLSIATPLRSIAAAVFSKAAVKSSRVTAEKAGAVCAFSFSGIIRALFCSSGVFLCKP